MKIDQGELSNGVRVVTAELSDSAAVSFHIYFGCGGRHERDEITSSTLAGIGVAVGEHDDAQDVLVGEVGLVDPVQRLSHATREVRGSHAVELTSLGLQLVLPSLRHLARLGDGMNL